ncbi:MAG: hypothetical protein WD029_04520 [Microthrixaceae bacterium]
MSERDLEELGSAYDASQPLAHRVWQHPSEVGFESRCRLDQIRSAWFGSSVLLLALSLLALGLALR